jgi:hypothetical protein
MRTGLARALVTTATMGCALLTTAGPAGAGPSDHHRVIETGPEFGAFWMWNAPGTSFTAQVHATNRLLTTSGSSRPSLVASLWTTRYDDAWNMTGETPIEVDTAAGYDPRFERPLPGATVRAAALPATSCDYDADLDVIGCTATTIGLAITVTGAGEIQKGPAIVVNQKAPGFQLHAWGNGSWQQATAVGTLARMALPVGEGYLSDGTTGLVLKRS